MEGKDFAVILYNEEVSEETKENWGDVLEELMDFVIFEPAADGSRYTGSKAFCDNQFNILRKIGGGDLLKCIDRKKEEPSLDPELKDFLQQY